MLKSFSKKKDAGFTLHIKSYVRGFTLIELLVVIAIIGLLVTIVLVSLEPAKAKARDVKGESELKQITTALEIKYTRNGRYPDLPDAVDNIPSEDARLSPYLSPVPYTNGSRIYQWYDGGGDNQKFCVLFEYETQSGYFTCSHRDCQVNDSPVCPNF